MFMMLVSYWLWSWKLSIPYFWYDETIYGLQRASACIQPIQRSHGPFQMAFRPCVHLILRKGLAVSVWCFVPWLNQQCLVMLIGTFSNCLLECNISCYYLCSPIRSLIETGFGADRRSDVRLYYGARNLKRMAYQVWFFLSLVSKFRTSLDREICAVEL